MTVVWLWLPLVPTVVPTNPFARPSVTWLFSGTPLL